MALASWATRRWWRNVENNIPDVSFADRPVYFVSSNTHALPNLLSGYALRQKDALVAYINDSGSEALRQESIRETSADRGAEIQKCLAPQIPTLRATLDRTLEGEDPTDQP